jgi:uracil-DNA glycosylase
MMAPVELGVDTESLASWTAAVPMMGEGYHEEVLQRVNALRAGQTIYPARERVVHALRLLPFGRVKVVIVGQDPYHGAGQADGLAFSVPEGVPAPPSLRNILQEVAEDVYGGAPPTFPTDLTRWARQGVLLLNASLTVEAGRAGSHRHLGWMALTDAIIAQLSADREHLVFMLWGRFAGSKRALIDGHRHLVLEAPHPSPLSAYRGFLGCRHFSKANAYLAHFGLAQIVW